MSTPDNTPQTNPSNPPAAVEAAKPAVRKRIPMSVPQRKLEVPEIPGFHLYWFRESSVPRAIQGGYEHVYSQDLPVNQLNVANDKGISGNQDLGSHVRIVGGVAEGGGVEYAVLMKIREEWWQEDQDAISKKNAGVMEAIFNKEQIIGSEKVQGGDRDLRYVKTALFNRPTRKAKPNS